MLASSSSSSQPLSHLNIKERERVCKMRNVNRASKLHTFPPMVKKDGTAGFGWRAVGGDVLAVCTPRVCTVQAERFFLRSFVQDDLHRQ